MNKTILPLINGWKFHYGECEDAWYKGYEDMHWKEVEIPHDWSVEMPFSRTFSSGTGYLAGGIGWYRVRFSLPEEYKGKSIRVVFDGVYKNSQVWCNSYYLGKRPNGYVSFSYDISACAVFGELDNEITVKVTHNDLADSRWFTGSGITRKVTIVVEEPVHPAEYGCFFETCKVETDGGIHTADVKVSHEIENRSGAEADLTVINKWLDADGKEVLCASEKINVAAGKTRVLSVTGSIKDVILWDMDKPYLYTLQTWFKKNGEEAYLADCQRIGIRTFVFDSQKGFYLNGKERKLKGVCVHHDGGCLGAAMYKEVWHRRLETLKKAGCNAVRCSHNPHMPELYDLCDELGMVMMDEAFDEWENPKNKWSTGHNVYPPKHQGYYEDFPEWHEKDLRSMVRRDRNHPSIIMWSIGNEIDYPNDPYCHPMFETMTGNNDANKPAAERRYDPNKPNAERLTVIARRLAEIVRMDDVSRPVTLAAAFPELSSHLGFLDSLDVAGYNYKEHLYEESHERFPNLPFLGSENGHSYKAWEYVKNNDYISGQFLWTGIDYLGEAHGWPIHGSGAGIIDCAGFEKSRYYRRASLWSEEPMVALSTKIWDNHDEEWFSGIQTWNYSGEDEEKEICVYVYSNLPKVRLSINGKECGSLDAYNADGAFRFLVSYEPGVLRAEGFDTAGNLKASAELCTSGAASVIDTNTWTPENGEKYGSIEQIEVLLKDEQGVPVRKDDRVLGVQVYGDGKLVGIESGDLADLTPYSENFRKTYQGHLILYIRRNGEKQICVSIREKNKTDGLKTEIIL